MARKQKLQHHYDTFPILGTERFILREITLSDADDMQEFICDEDMYKFWGAPISNNEKSGERYIRRNLTRKPGDKPNAITWGIEQKADKKIIGEIFINRVEDNRLAHVGYRISKKYWNNGIATEALTAVVKFCFGQTELKKLHTSVIAGNDASCRVLEKSGFTREGFIRQGKLFKNYCDFYLYGYLCGDYK